MHYTMRQCLKLLSRAYRDEIDDILKHQGFADALNFVINDRTIKNHVIALNYVFYRDIEMSNDNDN